MKRGFKGVVEDELQSYACIAVERHPEERNPMLL